MRVLATLLLVAVACGGVEPVGACADPVCSAWQEQVWHCESLDGAWKACGLDSCAPYARDCAFTTPDCECVIDSKYRWGWERSGEEEQAHPWDRRGESDRQGGDE